MTLNKRKKGLIKKAMEISLLTGVNLVITIFDKEDGKIIQYLSDSVDKFQAINQLGGNIQVRKRYLKGDQNPRREDLEAQPELLVEHDSKGAATKYITQPIVTEIYTNDHVSRILSFH